MVFATRVVPDHSTVCAYSAPTASTASSASAASPLLLRSPPRPRFQGRCLIGAWRRHPMCRLLAITTRTLVGAYSGGHTRLHPPQVRPSARHHQDRPPRHDRPRHGRPRHGSPRPGRPRHGRPRRHRQIFAVKMAPAALAGSASHAHAGRHAAACRAGGCVMPSAAGHSPCPTLAGAQTTAACTGSCALTCAPSVFTFPRLRLLRRRPPGRRPHILRA